MLLVAATAVGYRVRRLRAIILRGNATPEPMVPWRKRWANVAVMALGQRRMFRVFWVGILHLVVYGGFVLINVDVLEFLLDGVLGTHRIMAGLLGGWYGGIISALEFIALGVGLSCGIFLWRRNLGAKSRVRSAELRGWPQTDANLILVFEIILVGAFLLYNMVDGALQQRGIYPVHGVFFLSHWGVPWIAGLSDTALLRMAGLSWWGHLIGVFGFGYYVTFSKHLHIILAFVHTYYHRHVSSARMALMPQVHEAVLSRLVPDQAASPTEAGRLGAKEVNDLTDKQRLAAFSCTECGRCTEVCPAHQAGQPLSPRHIMMAVRDNATAGSRTDTPLLKGYIDYTALFACTTCQACIEACPVQINPMEIILSLRRYIAMETADTPKNWQQMFASMETHGAPWAFGSHAREDWVKKLSATS